MSDGADFEHVVALRVTPGSGADETIIAVASYTVPAATGPGRTVEGQERSS
jgi:hypothetical protein